MGYYPELAELVDEKLKGISSHEHPMSGLLGDASDLGDMADADLERKLQRLNWPEEQKQPARMG